MKVLRFFLDGVSKLLMYYAVF